MKNIHKIFFLAICWVLSLSGFSQGLHTSSGKALKIYNEGLSAYDYLDYAAAEKDFKQAVTIDKNFYEAYIMIGDLMAKQNRNLEAALSYKTAVKIDSLFFRPVFFNLANAEMMSGDYFNALRHFNVYLAQDGMSA